MREQREKPSIAISLQCKPQATFLTFCLERTLEDAGGIWSPSSQFPGAKEEGLWGPGGLGLGQQWLLPPTLSPFQHWVAFPTEHQ